MVVLKYIYLILSWSSPFLFLYRLSNFFMTDFSRVQNSSLFVRLSTYFALLTFYTTYSGYHCVSFFGDRLDVFYFFFFNFVW